MALEEFTLKPYGERKLKPKWYNRHVVFETGREQVQGITTLPEYSWELELRGVYSDMKYVEDFFNRHCGSRKTFNWRDRDGILHVVRFAADELDITDNYGKAFQCRVVFKKVYD